MSRKKSKDIDIFNEFESSPLEELSKIYDVSQEAHIIEFTLNMPHTGKFSQLMQLEQCDALHRAFRNGIKRLGDTTRKYKPDFVITYTHVFEHCKDGQIHLHAIIKLPKFRLGNFIYGSPVMDIVKLFTKYDGRNYTDKYLRYRCPKLCVQQTVTQARLNEWLLYISKEQSIKVK